MFESCFDGECCRGMPETPAARSNSSTPGRVKIPHHCDGVGDDYASA
jgi:hypothetical protein